MNIEQSTTSSNDGKEKYDEEIKLVVVGDSNVGKTSMITRYYDGNFNSECPSNTNAFYVVKLLKFGKKIYRINIWDTAGQEKYRSVTKIFLKQADIAIIAYAINDLNSFKDLDYWYKTIFDTCGKIIIGIAANKSDLYEEEVISLEEGKNKASELNAKFKLTSALNDEGFIDEFIEELIKEYIVKKEGNFDFEKNNDSYILKRIPKDTRKIKDKSCCQLNHNIAK